MFLDNNRKIICLSVPKTASTTCSTFFRQNIKFSHKFYGSIQHSTAQELEYFKILVHPLSEYQIYGIVRCPVERFISAANDLVSLKSELINGSCTTKQDLISLIDRILFYDFDIFEKSSIIFKPQSHWFSVENVNIYSYPNLSNFVEHICQIYGIDYSKFAQFERKKVAPIPVSVEDLNQKTKDKILEIYYQDKVLYDSVNN